MAAPNFQTENIRGFLNFNLINTELTIQNRLNKRKKTVTNKSTPFTLMFIDGADKSRRLVAIYNTTNGTRIVKNGCPNTENKTVRGMLLKNLAISTSGVEVQIL